MTDLQTPHFDLNARPFDVPRIVDACASLLSLTTSQAVNDGGRRTSGYDRTEVTLAHDTVKTFLYAELSVTWDRSSSEHEAHSLLFRSCVDYLRQLREVEDLALFPLASYAASRWLFHLKRSDAATGDLEMGIGGLILLDETVFSTWLRLYDIDRLAARRKSIPWEKRYEHITGTNLVTPLYCASSLGLKRLCTALLERGADPNEKCPGTLWKTLSDVASVYKHQNILILLKKYSGRSQRELDVQTLSQKYSGRSKRDRDLQAAESSKSEISGEWATRGSTDPYRATLSVVEPGSIECRRSARPKPKTFLDFMQQLSKQSRRG